MTPEGVWISELFGLEKYTLKAMFGLARFQISEVQISEVLLYSIFIRAFCLGRGEGILT